MHGDLPGSRGKGPKSLSAKPEEIARDHSLGLGAVLLRATGQLRQSPRHRCPPCEAWARGAASAIRRPAPPGTVSARGSRGLARAGKQARLSTTAKLLIRKSPLASPAEVAASGAELAGARPGLLQLTAPVGGHGSYRPFGKWPR
jgi:hypothetical protein